MMQFGEYVKVTFVYSDDGVKGALIIVFSIFQ